MSRPTREEWLDELTADKALLLERITVALERIADKLDKSERPVGEMEQR